MRKKTKFSIITPSYNQGEFLEETILSVLNQDYPNLEYIIIDGGSNDNSVEIIKKYQKSLKYWVSEPDKGQSDAINKGLKIATGSILQWLNSDDVLMKGALNYINEYFNKNPDKGCMIGDLQLINLTGKFTTLIKAVPFHFNSALFTTGLVPQPSTFFTRRAWEKTGNLDISLTYQFDYEYFLRMAKAGVKFGILRKSIAQFRLHPDSKTVSEYNNLFFESVTTIQDYYLPSSLKNAKFKNKYLKLLKLFYKIRIFIARAFLRGDFIPFRAKIARIRILK